VIRERTSSRITVPSPHVHPSLADVLKPPDRPLRFQGFADAAGGLRYS